MTICKPSYRTRWWRYLVSTTARGTWNFGLILFPLTFCIHHEHHPNWWAKTCCRTRQRVFAATDAEMWKRFNFLEIRAKKMETTLPHWRWQSSSSPIRDDATAGGQWRITHVKYVIVVRYLFYAWVTVEGLSFPMTIVQGNRHPLRGMGSWTI